MDEFNREFEGNIDFGYGFDAAVKAYRSLSWWERLTGKPIGFVTLDKRNDTSIVSYRD